MSGWRMICLLLLFLWILPVPAVWAGNAGKGADLRNMLRQAQGLRAAGDAQAAAAILRRAIARAGKSADAAMLYRLWFALGGMDTARRHLDAALSDYDKARALAAAAAARGGALRPQWLHRAWAARDRMGDLTMNLRGAEQAAAIYGRALKDARAMHAARPRNAQWRLDLARALGKVAAGGNAPRRHYEEALALLARMPAEGPLAARARFWRERIAAALRQLRHKAPRTKP